MSESPWGLRHCSLESVLHSQESELWCKITESTILLSGLPMETFLEVMPPKWGSEFHLCRLLCLVGGKDNGVAIFRVPGLSFPPPQVSCTLLLVASLFGCFPGRYQLACISPKRQSQQPPQIEYFLIHPSNQPTIFTELLLCATQGGWS